MAAGEGEQGGTGKGALALALVALFASWNPVAAPFGLIVGVAAIVLGARALRRAGERRKVPASALAMGVVAVAASATVLLLTAGAVGVELPGQPVVRGRTAAELERVLREAAERTRPQRERAAEQLDRQAGEPRRGALDGGSRR